MTNAVISIIFFIMAAMAALQMEIANRTDQVIWSWTMKLSYVVFMVLGVLWLM